MKIESIDSRSDVYTSEPIPSSKYDSGELSVYFVGRTNASDSEDENIVHNDIEGDDFDENEDRVDVNDDKLINDLIVHGSSVKVGDHFVFIVFGPDIVGVSISI